MLCTEFENRLTDYLDGALEAGEQRMFAEHALRCPVCHDTLTEVKKTVDACRVATIPSPKDLEARILLSTMPETAMNCADFEESLTDYLDGFLPAPLFHRWERHAVLCANCTELPGEVVRAIGACYTYIGEEQPVPEGLNERIMAATLGTIVPQELRAPFGIRVAAWLRSLLDPIVSPQLATVATMLLVAIFVLTSTVSADGSIRGLYSASLRLASQSYKGDGSNGGVKEITDGLKEMVGGKDSQGNQQQRPNEQKAQPKPSKSPASNNQ